MIRFESEERDGIEIGHIVLARPEKRNALTPEMLDHIADAASEGARTCRALTLIGEGRAFCAGFDLTLCADDPGGGVMDRLLTGLSLAVGAMRSLEIPVVIGAHAAAVAGGCALLGGGDIVVADRACKLGYPVTRLGVSPAVSVPFLRAGVGDGGARAVTLDPGLIDSVRAHALGLVHELVDGPEAVFERTRELAFVLALKPAGAITATKGLLNELDRTTESSPIEWALEASLSLSGTDEQHRRIERALRPSED